MGAAVTILWFQGNCEGYCQGHNRGRDARVVYPFAFGGHLGHLLASEGGYDTVDGRDLLGEDDASIARDMQYNNRNLQRQNRNFQAIRAVGGKEVVRDVYARDPQSQTFWFVGKAASVSDVSVEDCVARQWNLIETYAVNLRTLDLFAARGVLEIWTAPGDSEIDVAYNRPDVVFKKHARGSHDTSGNIKNSLVGFQGEVYAGGEEGFRTWRLDDGRPARSEVQQPTEDVRAPTDGEMQKIQQALEGKDIGEVYEEQQRRLGARP